MNIGNITSDNFNLDGNGKDMQIEVYEQLIEQLQQENKKYKEVIDKAIKYIKSHKTDYSPYELSDYNIRQILDILNEELE